MHTSLLYVEDEPDDRDLFSLALARLKLQVTLRVVPTAAAAQQYLQGQGAYADRAQFPVPDLVVLDWRLPGLTGAGFLDWCNRSASKPLPVVVLTGSPFEEGLSRAQQLGAALVLPKPASVLKLQSLIQQMLELRA